ncbi:hypothetical protein WR25_22922 [Diploscapter pachys]|uniref:Ig-like domain-containing protein n=1 Tax=Diploscapter pachys TaxID=2018661 RepID=A0A2A2L2W8_9BILA|nr:hypothetical protein WR25_22922 [Diploscapter pachys]
MRHLVGCLLLFFLHDTFSFKPIKIIDVEDEEFEKDIKNWWQRRKNSTKPPSESEKLARFRAWLKYDTDCQWLSTDELNEKIKAGRCPPISVTTEAPNKNKMEMVAKLKAIRKRYKKRKNAFISHNTKQSVMRQVMTGQNSMRDYEITADTQKLSIKEGTFANFVCDVAKRKKEKKEREKKNKKRFFIWGWIFDNTTEIVDWYVNGNEVQQLWYDWRVSLSYDGELGIWPINKSDTGHIECYVNGEFRVSAELEVFTLGEAVLKSFRNFGYSCAFFCVIAIIIVFFVSDITHPTKKIAHIDRMEEFMANQLLYHTDKVKVLLFYFI